ncbi:uncharacterized protein TM35_000023900 [Trypanosoma theileri]|uniref:Uncharacterized protein n=1 Tax=Trypanosoma theileri TaxID=67003 RepID=A0A1X0P817_9TRYP|nr:uncharacterized protein TM35_000023900 [Trypanosoma theileri]ORC93064.1 hypothetical protein TM35_000023900 [Trypanosoma theileri]
MSLFLDIRVAIVELVCAEHLQRTLLSCDEATSFQRIVSQAVACRRGEWGFEQYNHHYNRIDGMRECEKMGMGDTPYSLIKRDAFMRREGELLNRIAAASKEIRRTSSVLYPNPEPSF